MHFSTSPAAFATFAPLSNSTFVPLRTCQLCKSTVPVVAKRIRAPLPAEIQPSTIPPQCTQTAPRRPPASKPTTARKPTVAPKLTAEGDSLQTTPSQVAHVATHFGLCALLLLRTLGGAGGTSEIATDIGMVFAAYTLTDLLVGVYHHAVDNYGSKDTPIFGYQIAAFQGHHVFPWTITNRGFANNVYRLTKPLIPQLVALLFFPFPPGWYTMFHTSVLMFIVLAQEAHRQAHMLRPEPWAKRLQELKVIVSQRDHAAHHRVPFDDNYCILSGHWNPILDRIRFFRVLEGIIFVLTGNEAECWKLNPDLKTESMSFMSHLELGNKLR